MGELVVRFLVGGVLVSTFALLGEIFRPKSFAGLFGAAPSIALATVGLPIPKDEAPRATSGKVVNLMDALRKSLGEKAANIPKKPVASEKSPAREGIGLVRPVAKGGTKRKSA